MTIKLYDNDSYATEFDAVILSCEKCDDNYKTVLDQTLFFPEEGGQCADKGQIDGIDIIHVEILGDTIYHYSKIPFETGKNIHGKIDFKLRFRNMQNHSGEHIICGIAHKLFGYENVGFHLGENYVTMDLDGELSFDDIKKIEYLANEAVIKNMPVICTYPEEDELLTMNFRAKGNIEEKVRVVTIGDVDSCACCAPHVRFTGEIGIIKILDSMRHRGGMRLNILCGFDALADYEKRYQSSVEISNLLSVKQEEIVSGVQKLMSDMNTLKALLDEKTRQLAKYIADTIDDTQDNICLFCDDLSSEYLRFVANDVKKKTSTFAVVLSGNDTDGYNYVIATNGQDVSAIVKEANSVLSGRGGGRDTMASGIFLCSKEKIQEYFSR